MHKLFGVQGSWIFLTLTFWVSCGVKFKGFLGLKVRSYHWARRAGSKISFRRREDAKTRAAPHSVAASQRRDTAKTRAVPPAASQRRSVTTPRKREDASSPPAAWQRRSVAKTRRREETPATWQRRSVAKTRRHEETPAAWQRRSIAASRHREDESSPLSGVTVITESPSCIFENQNANALPSFLPSFPWWHIRRCLQISPKLRTFWSCNLLPPPRSCYRKPVGDTGWLKYMYMPI